MAKKERTIQSQFTSEHQARSEILERARECAALSKPWVLPPQHMPKTTKMPEPFQSLCSRGVTNIEGRMLLALWPPGMPWFQQVLSPTILYDSSSDPETIQMLEMELMLQDLTVVSLLESVSLQPSQSTYASGFRTNKRKALSQILITGETLETLTKDYRIKVFRRDRYVNKRNTEGDILYHVIQESIDPVILDEKQLALAEINDEHTDKPVADRMKDLYTRVSWQPLAKTWLIEQECNKKIINVSEEPVSPYFCTAFELAPDEDYGRGFIELNLGDAKSLDELREKMLDFAAMASKMHPVIDEASMLTEEDLARESGEVLRAKVQGGQVQDLSFLRVDKPGDFSVVNVASETIRKDLAAAMLMETEVTPRGDRVTALQVQKVSNELEGALGGFYAPVADSQQMQVLRRTIYQARKDKLLKPLPDKLKKVIEIRALTGIAGLSRELDKARMVELVQMIAQIPQAAARINMGVFVNAMVRLSGFFEPGLIKSEQQVQAEIEQAMQLAAQQRATSKGIDVAGNAIEAALAPQP